MGLTINIDKPIAISANKRFKRSQSYDMLCMETEYTVKGLFYNTSVSFNAPSNYIEQQINSLPSDTKKDVFSSSINIKTSNEAKSFGDVSILDISIDSTSTNDAQDKVYSVTFLDKKPAIDSRLTSIINLPPDKIKDIEEVSLLKNEENTTSYKKTTTTLNISAGLNAKLQKSDIDGIASSVLEKESPSGSNKKTGTKNLYASSIDENQKIFSYQQIKFEYPNEGILKNNSFNIQGDGSIIAIQNIEFKFKEDITLKEMESEVNTKIGESKKEIQTFIDTYYTKGYDTLPSNYNKAIKEMNRSISLDHSAGIAQCSLTFSNNAGYIEKQQISILETLDNLPAEGIVKKNIRGTIIGTQERRSKKLTLGDNKKLNNALEYFKNNYGKELNNAPKKERIQIGNVKGILSNAELTLNISEGSLDFSLSYIGGKAFENENDKIVYGKGEYVNEFPSHLANRFLLFGPDGDGGKEIAQASDQSNYAEKSINLDLILKNSSDTVKFSKDSLVNILKSNEIIKEGNVLKNVNINYNIITCNYKAQATWHEFGTNLYREKSDISQRVEKKSIKFQ